MNLTEVRQHYYAQPFQPIEFEFRDGRRASLDDRIHMRFNYPRTKVILYDPQDNRLCYDLRDIVAIRPLTEHPAASS